MAVVLVNDTAGLLLGWTTELLLDCMEVDVLVRTVDELVDDKTFGDELERRAVL